MNELQLATEKLTLKIFKKKKKNGQDAFSSIDSNLSFFNYRITKKKKKYRKTSEKQGNLWVESDIHINTV